MGSRLLIVALVGLLAGAIWVAYQGLGIDPNFNMPPEGYVAMVMGIVLSLVVGCGLMALVFYSSRRGYDDRAAAQTQQGDSPTK